MSFITDINTIFKNEYPNGTFIFYNQFMADRELMKVDPANFPVMVVDTSIDRDGEIASNFNMNEATNFVVYLLAQDKNDNTAIQSEAIISPLRNKMRDIIARFYREAEGVVNDPEETKSYRISDVYKIMGAHVSGVMVRMNPKIAYVPNVCVK